MFSRYKDFTDFIKDIADLARKGQKLEMEKKILELSGAILDLQKENQELRSENQRLQDQSTTRDNLVWEQPVYWLEKDGKREGPYCQVCWDDKKNLARLHGDNHAFLCRVCEKGFEKPNSDMPRFKGQGIADSEAGY